MRFLFVGDSMTIGRAGEVTWRHELTRHLAGCAACAGPGPAEVVGPWSHQYGEDHDGTTAGGAHLAAWGEGWLHMASRIGPAVAEHAPDVLLVSLGLIDLGFYTDSAQTEANVRRFVAEARAAGPGTSAVVLPVVPNVRADTDALFAAEVGRFNGRLAAALSELTDPHSPLVLAPTPTAPPVAYDIHRDTYDGTHPAPSGARKLATAFARALHALRGAGASYHPCASPCSDHPATEAAPTARTAPAAGAPAPSPAASAPLQAPAAAPGTPVSG
ncbi:GDSL-type esterase/lipase family protein [Streptomyces tremellae]|uniref:GDSL-type esterase/lipase family protein n=1 Tax=Streptomyces tremellae TaxID=1124239 RepID=A0ABP7FJN1_9ACTN